MKKRSLFLIILFYAIVNTGFAAENWPTWRGPDTAGIAQSTNPPVKWSESENIKWKIPLTGDASNSTPIIWENKIIFQTAVDTGQKIALLEQIPPVPQARGGRGGRSGRGGFGGGAPSTKFKFNLVCLDKNNGKLLWEKTVTEAKPHQGHHRDHGFASFCPVTDGKHVWATYGSRGVYCYDLDGNILWNKELPQLTTTFGEGGAPSLAGDAVIVVSDQRNQSYIFAFDKKTGDILWKKERDEDTTYATPLPVTVDGKLQVIVNATGFIRGYDAKNGDVIWQCTGMTRNVIPTPVAGNGMVYCTSGFRGSALLAIKLGKTGDLTGSDAIAWKVDSGTPYVPSPLLYEGRIYVCKVNQEIISCYDAKTGKPHFTEQKLDEIKGIYASPTAAAGKIYFVGRNGVSYVLKASDKLEVLAVNTLEDNIDCSPVFVGDELFLKAKKNLYCITGAK